MTFLHPRRRTVGTALVGLAAALLSAAAAGPARAGVIATYEDIGPVLTVQYRLNGAAAKRVQAGEIHFSSSTPGFDPGFSSYCIEITQEVHSGPVEFAIVPLKDAPNSSAPPGLVGPMGTLKADYLGELWADQHAAIDTNVEAAAFQSAIWKIVYSSDADFLSGAWRNLNAGAFRITSPTSVRTLGNSYLAALDGQGPRAQLIALTSPNYQDQLTVPTAPEPTSLLLGGVGAAGLGLAAWRRRRQTAC